MKKVTAIVIVIIVIISAVWIFWKYQSFQKALVRPLRNIPAADCERRLAEDGFINFLQKSNMCKYIN